MSFTFRLRFRLAEGNRINDPGSELVLRNGPIGQVRIRPLHSDLTVAEEVNFELRGQGYATEVDAVSDGRRWISALAIGCMAELVPADFETRKPKGSISPRTIEAIESEAGGLLALYSDEPGLLVVPEDPPPTWGRFGATMTAGRNAPAAMAAIIRAYREQLDPDDRTMLAYDLYCAAESAASDVDVRFLMLMFAVEALIEVGRRPAEQVATIDRLREALADMTEVEEEDRLEVANALGRLRTESIGAAGRRLAASLGERRYDGKDPVDFFRYAYGVRSKLVHGEVGKGRPDVEVVRALHGPMLWFVRDLILARGGAATWPHPFDGTVDGMVPYGTGAPL